MISMKKEKHIKVRREMIETKKIKEKMGIKKVREKKEIENVEEKIKKESVEEKTETKKVEEKTEIKKVEENVMNTKEENMRVEKNIVEDLGLEDVNDHHEENIRNRKYSLTFLSLILILIGWCYSDSMASVCATYHTQPLLLTTTSFLTFLSQVIPVNFYDNALNEYRKRFLSENKLQTNYCLF
ncbi:hypothetical protein EDI_219600 [Entamoeba dispar SAW760]|uniref:Uncharacterized protein n=1 Tax=Entamoeba dispar (strain ATCC PRA-260 / SAW760) TaxID=370354 RepID=B0EQ98_ENTDS|nr:uncharacterized protein EDI_219600 [Entamoeba dispar SAW760]EDR23321.1 hypothetical protein EDI_219600 [Entamoeba dispar SAW760]|eukprot:EDR23321.1 hypothetical protein EDI_219600 [Entamoeba dispar SAW760]